MNINSLIQEAYAGTPDPGRSLKNLNRLLHESPETLQEHRLQIEVIARLFAYSQFLADYITSNPSSLSRALKDPYIVIDKQKILSEAYNKYTPFQNEERPSIYKQEAMKLLREIKKEYLLFITLKDISGITSLNECMSELSILSEAIIELALDMSSAIMRRKFGFLRENAFSLIGMGKLGAGELNYSSDIDIITVYRSEESISTGILNPFGIRHNKISSHEYFCTLIEILTNLLQSPTEDGIAYRVDLRLRPNGQKGAPSLSLDSYRSYYEAWGKTWERMALIRARPIAGDSLLGERFIHTIEPFVWKRSMDYNDIEEVRELKKRIDAISDMNDIKRGYGGIREIEFFIHTFQLLYGGERKKLRKGSLITVLKELLQEGFLPRDDIRTLSESYIFLRRIEHILQMKDDMQIYALPAMPEELEVLSRKMNFEDKAAFTADLRLKRLKVRDMYNSLLGGTDATQEIILSLRDELPEGAILDYLSFKGFQNPHSAHKNINAILDQISTGKTLRERNLLRKMVPTFLEQIVKSVNKDRALGMLVSFIRKIGNHESYIDLLLQRNDTRQILVETFSSSTYLTRLLLSLENLECIFEYPDIRTDYHSLLKRLVSSLDRSTDPLNIMREFKFIEELKTGMLFLKGFIDIYGLSQAMSMLAETIIKGIFHYLHIKEGFAVIGLGGFGAGELSIGSDLDLMFVRTQDRSIPVPEKGPAEELIRFLSEYTPRGFAYKVDLRLRPDGSKGILVNAIDGYENYYFRNAQPWEIQSLLRARPIAGDSTLAQEFELLKRQIILQRGAEISGIDMRDMRKRIISKISKESSGYDVKNGPGGIKEIEFLVQYLQIKHAASQPALIMHNTVSAIGQLRKYGFFDDKMENMLLSAHRFLKTVDTFLRLNEEDVLKTNSEIVDIIIRFLNLSSGDQLFKQIEDTRGKILKVTRKFYA